MQHKILLAVDDSAHSKRAVRYAVRMNTVVRNLSYTLLTIQPNISQFLIDEAKSDIRSQGALEKLKKRNIAGTEKLLGTYRSLMVELGVAEDKIEIVTRPKKRGAAKDVLEFAEKKQYDAIVVGRRGLSRMEEVFMGSLTASLLEHSQVIPVWVIDGEISSDKILISVDGSESALRAVDHLSFMLAGNPDIRITFFHVMPRFKDYCAVDFTEEESDLKEIIIKGEERRVENFFGVARRKFADAGIEEIQLDVKQVKRTMNIGKAVVEEAATGDYGTVVIGRRGVNKAFFMGSVSKYVLDKITDRAIWLVS